MRFRSVLFWLHLIAGLAAGAAIGIMCFTGAALAFESEIVAWAERDARRVEPPAENTAGLPLAELIKKVREAKPDAKPTGIVVSADPRAAVIFNLGRDSALYVNPYTGAVRTPASTLARDFMRTMTDWHRWLAIGGDHRPVGKAINGACNLAFFVLAVSGLYLWLPRSWSWRSVKAVAIFNARLTGKARDFNWHNAIGLWSAPVLIVLTLTAVPISYRWGTALVYRLAGEAAPAQSANPGGAPTETISLPKPPEGTRPQSYDALLAVVQKEIPNWEQITLRLGNGENRRGAQPTSFMVKSPGTWPRTATTTLTLNPYTGEIIKQESFADLTQGRRLRTWTRFLHTGQALGWGGQLIAGLACLGGGVLVYTGFALAWRRFFPGKRANAS